MKRISPLSRRALLRGAGGVAIGLPLLELMFPGRRRAFAADPAPKRFCVMFAGAMSAGQGSGQNHFVPGPQHKGSTPLPEGPDYPLTAGLAALGTHGVKGDVAIVSGLLTPSGSEAGTARWRGGDEAWHSGGCYAQIMGTTVGPGDIGSGGQNFCKGEGPDYTIAKVIEPGGSTARVLNLGVQPVAYSEPNSTLTVTFKKSGSNFVPATNIGDPGIVWDMLFKGGAAPTTPPPGGTPAPKTADSYSANVLDLVKNDVNRLMARVGNADKVRLEQYFDEINDLQKKIGPGGGGIAPGPMMGGGCQIPPDPRLAKYPAVRSMGNYSGESQRARIMADLLYMAFVCDKTRASSLLLSQTQSIMETQPLVASTSTDLHSSNHGQVNPLEHGQLLNWHMDQFAYFLAKLKATPEGAGTMLDNTAVMLFFEGGCGRHTDGSQRTMYGSHTSEDVVILVGGRAGGLKVGQHYIEKGTNPANVTLTVLRALGHVGNYNEVSEIVPRLLG